MKESIFLTLGGNSQVKETKNSKIIGNEEERSKFESHFVSAFKEQTAAINDANGKKLPVSELDFADANVPSEIHRQFLRGGRSIIVGGENPTEEEVKAFAEFQGIDPKGLITVVHSNADQENNGLVNPSEFPEDEPIASTGRENGPSQSLLPGEPPRKTLVFSDQGILKAIKQTEIISNLGNSKEIPTKLIIEQPPKNGRKLEFTERHSMANGTNISDGHEKPKIEPHRILPSNKSPIMGHEQKVVSPTFSELNKGNTKFNQSVRSFSPVEPIKQDRFLKDAQKIILTSDFKDKSDIGVGPKVMLNAQFEKGEIRRAIAKMIEGKIESKGATRERVSLAPIDLTDVLDQLPEELQVHTVRKSIGSHPEVSSDISNLRPLAKDSTLLSDTNTVKVSKPQGSELDGGLLESLRKSIELEPVARKMSEMVGQRLLAQISRGSWRVEMELYPRSLGRVEIHLEMVNGQLEAHFQTNQSLTREILAEGIPRLKESLEEHGMESAYVSVELENRKENDKNQTSSDQNGNLDSIVDSDEGQKERKEVNPLDLDGRLDFFV